MEQALPARAPVPAQEMRIQIAEEQEQLEEEHAGGPHGGTSPKPRQDHFAHHRLDLEQQEGADEYGRGAPAGQACSFRSHFHSLATEYPA
jgi:hypothetical protein